MIKEDNLGLPAVGTLLDQHVARVRVTVNETVDKDHFTVHFAQLLRDLWPTQWRNTEPKHQNNSSEQKLKC